MAIDNVAIYWGRIRFFQNYDRSQLTLTVDKKDKQSDQSEKEAIQMEFLITMEDEKIVACTSL